MAVESYEMSKITLLDDTDRHIIHAFGAKMVLLMSSFLVPLVLCQSRPGCCAMWGHNCFSAPSLSPTPQEKKHHGWHIFDTVHLFCLWAMHFKEGQDAAVAKCVPNKWYPGQNGSSSESVLAKGSKSMWLRQHPSSLRAVTLSGGTNGLSWLGSSEGLWPRASSHLGELAAPLGPPSEKR